MGYWRFEDNLVTDYSRNGNHGTLTSTDEDTYGLPIFSSDRPGIDHKQNPKSHRPAIDPKQNPKSLRNI